MYLMLKDDKVMEINEAQCKIINYELLPLTLRKKDVSIEDYLYTWIGSRTLPLDRAFAKNILNSLRIGPTNTYMICKSCNGVSMTDCYWLKDNNTNVTWNDINYWQNEINLAVAGIALCGTSTLRNNRKIKSPELLTLGMSAKCWNKYNNKIYMYKVAKKELAASEILDNLGIEHVKYEMAGEDELADIVTSERKEKIKIMNEVVVKSELLTTPKKSLQTFQDFSIYCEYHNINPYEEIIKIDKKHYYHMQIADYILNNSDRHIENWGVYLDNSNGKITGLYPLMDHDHAFDLSENIMSQVYDDDTKTLYDGAKAAIMEENISFDKVLNMKKPLMLTDEEWDGVCKRTKRIKALI